MTIESLALTIAKARHGTDAHWANYMDAAKAFRDGIDAYIINGTGSHERPIGILHTDSSLLRSPIAQPDGAQ